jgi:hypothetical protein
MPINPLGSQWCSAVYNGALRYRIRPFGRNRARHTGAAVRPQLQGSAPRPTTSHSGALFGVPIGTRVDRADSLHRRLNPCTRRFAASKIPQCSRPFADRLTIDVIAARAAIDSSKRISVLVDGQPSKLERVPQKLLCLSPHFVMYDDSEHCL